MDHHLSPLDPIDDEVKVPFVARETYDGGPFLTYPTCKGFHWSLSEKSPWEMITVLLPTSFPPMTTSDQESFFQTWLYFGLLQLIYREFFDINEYKQDEGAKIYLTTKNLLTRMRQASLFTL